jgi:branched-chain amino acid transport system permease protein
LKDRLTRNWIVLAGIWTVLLLAPYWMAPLGGYTALATRVLVLGLAAMSLNFLLGFTGVLSFGHAAWFGLGAYGAGLTLKYLALSTPLAVIVPRECQESGNGARSRGLRSWSVRRANAG